MTSEQLDLVPKVIAHMLGPMLAELELDLTSRPIELELGWHRVTVELRAVKAGANDDVTVQCTIDDAGRLETWLRTYPEESFTLIGSPVFS